MFVRFHTTTFLLSVVMKNVRFVRNDIYHHLALLWRICDCGAAYKNPDLLTYLPVAGGLGWVHDVGALTLRVKSL